MAFIKIKILSDFESRKGGSLFVVDAIDVNNRIMSVFLSPDQKDKIHEHGYFALTGCKVTTNNEDVKLMLNKSSKIFKTCQFNTDDKVINDFYNSPVLPLQQILSENVIHRLSVKGKIKEIYGTRHNDDWSRKDVILEDGPAQIRIKFWNGMVKLLNNIATGSTVMMKNLTTTQFNGIVSLNSKQQTKIEMVENNDTKTITIEGVDESRSVSPPSVTPIFPWRHGVKVDDAYKRDVELLHMTDAYCNSSANRRSIVCRKGGA